MASPDEGNQVVAWAIVAVVALVCSTVLILFGHGWVILMALFVLMLLVGML